MWLWREITTPSSPGAQRRNWVSEAAQMRAK
jgi:hypothetical protein